jgi:hypothetical protein
LQAADSPPKGTHWKNEIAGTPAEPALKGLGNFTLHNNSHDVNAMFAIHAHADDNATAPLSDQKALGLWWKQEEDSELRNTITNSWKGNSHDASRTKRSAGSSEKIIAGAAAVSLVVLALARRASKSAPPAQGYESLSQVHPNDAPNV